MWWSAIAHLFFLFLTLLLRIFLQIRYLCMPKTERMNCKTTFLWMAPLLLTLASCRQHYVLTDVTRSRILIDKRYDATPEPEANAFLQPYRHVVDSIMSPVVGEAAKDMAVHRPESDLSNLLADIMCWAAKDYNEQVDFAVYNMGGIRAALKKGKVTFGDIVDIAPFENKICFLTLSGDKVKELFSEMAYTGGEGVSKGVKLVFTNDRKLRSCALNGRPIDDKASYRVATIDYLAQGNDKLTAFKSGTNLNSPKTQENDTRFIITNYFRHKMAQGEPVNSQVEGRIMVEK